MDNHLLVNGTLKALEHGVVARCTCGWSSWHHSSLVASAVFREHQETAERARWQEECERLREIQAELKQAVDLMMQEIVASGNWDAKDFGWPKAIAAAKTVQRHFDPALAHPAKAEE